MSEVNGTDHLVRHDKETKLNGYDNEGFHSQDRSEEEGECATDDDRLRIVVNENGHRPGEDNHISNGYLNDELHGHSAAMNGTAVVVLEDTSNDSAMEDSKEHSQKPLDTRLNHYVPADSLDRKILNGSDSTHVTIPEDAVICFPTGRVKVKKGSSNSHHSSTERESIPLETMLPTYDAEDKIGLSEKAELEAQLENHKNGLWSEGHKSYANAERPFGNSEKLNGISKSSDEVGLPVNNLRKCLSTDVSDTSSEQMSTGEKLYFTEDNRKICSGWRRVFVCGLILIILAVALLLGVLAATGILLAESENKNSRYESGHSLPSIDSISHAGHSSRPRPSPKVPHKFLPPVTEDTPPNATIHGMDNTVTSPPQPSVNSKVPVLNDTSHSQTIVPNALVGEFTITDENFTEDLKDNTSHGYTSLATHIEYELRRIFKRSGGIFDELKILSFSPGSIKIKFVVIWRSDHNVILSDKAVEIMKSYLRRKNNLLLAFPVDMSSIKFIDVFDECRVQKGGCSFDCFWDYNTLSKRCMCDKNMILLQDEKSCGPIPSTSTVQHSTPSFLPTSELPITTTELPLIKESTKNINEPLQNNYTTTPLPTILTTLMGTISELFSRITTTENITEEATTSLSNLHDSNELSANLETTTNFPNYNLYSTTEKQNFTAENLENLTNTYFNISEVFENKTAAPKLNNQNSTEISLNYETSTDSFLKETSTVPTFEMTPNKNVFWRNHITTETYTEAEAQTDTTLIPTDINETSNKSLAEKNDFMSTTNTVSTESEANNLKNNMNIVPEATTNTSEENTTELITESTFAQTSNFKLNPDVIEATTQTARSYNTTDTTIFNLPSEITETTTNSVNTYSNKIETNEENPNSIITITETYQDMNSSGTTTTEIINIQTSDLTVATNDNNTLKLDTTTDMSYTKEITTEFNVHGANNSDKTMNEFFTTTNDGTLNINKNFGIVSFNNFTDIGENYTITPTDFNTNFTENTNLTDSSTYFENSSNNETFETIPVTNQFSTIDTLKTINYETTETVTMINESFINHTPLTTETIPHITDILATNFSFDVSNETENTTDFPDALMVPSTSSISNNVTEFYEEVGNETLVTESFKDTFASEEPTGLVSNFPIKNSTEEVTVNNETNITEIYTVPSSTEEPTNVGNNATTIVSIEDEHFLNNETFENSTNSETTNLSETVTVTPVYVTTIIEPSLNESSTEIGTENDNITNTGVFELNSTEEMVFNTTENLNSTFLNSMDETETFTTTNIPSTLSVSNETSAENFTEFGLEDTSNPYANDTFDTNVTDSYPISTVIFESTEDEIYITLENSTLVDRLIDTNNNSTTIGFYSEVNETTTVANTGGLECREDQFLCEPLNKCINDTFMCDGIEDCPDGYDEFQCKDTCHFNYMCANSSTCIMSDARCDGIWDCENGSDEESCTPTECAKHEVMCSDNSKCIKPGDICDWKYNCNDRSDEVGCVERTTCESGGRFFCNDGLCIPWSLKCDGEFDCKDKEDEANCTCFADEFRCNDGKCLKSSSRCDGHQDCHDADDEMGCVTIDSQHVVSTYEPYSGTWALLCAEDWNLDDGQYLCQELGFGHALNIERVHISFNGTWMAMRRENLTDSSLWTQRVSFVESCTSNLAAVVECEKFACGEYTGLLHRRKRDVISTSSSQWPFIGYASTFQSNRGCLSEILTPIWLITSADCLLSISKEPFNGSDWYVKTNFGKDIDPDLAQNHEVLRIISHPHSSKFRSLTLRDYDVALIRLKHALVFISDKIGAICPPEEQVPPGITCFSGVLGTEKPRSPPPDILAINSLALQITDRRNCNRVEHFNEQINHRMLCTQSSEGHTICDNDEGTPLMCLTGINKWFLAGMLTYQRYCDVYNKHPAVFSNLFSMRKFIDQVIGQKQYEVPYDSSIYIIIPPTTPSPTSSETTTSVITTVGTTHFTLGDTTLATTEGFENETIGLYADSDVSTSEELAREETYTVVPDEITTHYFLNASTEETQENETVTERTVEFDTFNSTLEDSEILNDFALNKSRNDYLMMPVSNDTNIDDDFNVTDNYTLENSTNISENSTFDLSDIITSLHDLTTTYSNETELDDSNNTTESFIFNVTDATTISNIDILNATEETTPYLLSSENATDVYPEPIIISLNNSIRNDSFELNLNESHDKRMTESLILNNLEILVNESTAISQPLIFSMNETTSMNVDSFTSSSLEEFDNSSTSNIDIDQSNTTIFNDTETNIPNITLHTNESSTTEIAIESKVTTNSDSTDSFSFEFEAEPYSDLEFAVFNDSKGMKIESYHLAEEVPTKVPTEVYEDINIAIYLNENTTLPTSEIILPTKLEPVLTTSVSPLFNGTDLEENLSMNTPPTVSVSEMNSTWRNKSALFIPNSMLENKTLTEAQVNKTMARSLSTEYYIGKDNMEEYKINKDFHIENNTDEHEINVDFLKMNDSVENLDLNDSSVTSELDLLLHNIIANNTCGLWNYNPTNGSSQNVDIKWPALGALQMTSSPKLCAATAISSKFVISSISCMLMKDSELDPGKWFYRSGFYQHDILDSNTQNNDVAKIISYLGKNDLNASNNLVLIELNDTLQFNDMSKKACLPVENMTTENECFTVGWSKNATENFGNEFYSIPTLTISEEECNSAMNYNETIINSMCGYLNRSTHACDMDSGSPLFCLNKNRQWEIRGLLNTSDDCDSAQPMVFDNIANIQQWIIEVLSSSESSNE